jgi:PAS domain S-box-containing protein
VIAAVAASNGDRRLEQLYEISKLFVSFDVVEHTLDAALKVIADKLPLASAILIETVIGGHSDMIVWQCEGCDPEQLRLARTHAADAYAYLVGAPSFRSLDLHEGVREVLGPTMLPALGRDRVAPDDARRFIVLPLVVGGGTVFGALQFEGAVRLDRGDLEFVNAIANQLAIALDRNRAWSYDVLRRREAQRLQAKYETLVDHLDYAFVWEANAETRRVSYVSAQFERMLGFHRQWCIDEPDWWGAHVHADDREMLRQTFERALVEPGNKRCEHHCVAADGSIRWLRTSIHLVGTGDEPPVLQGVSFDITAARAAQEAVREQLSFISTMASTLAEGTVAIDLEDRITFINDAGAALLGCDRREALGKRSASIAHVETSAGVVVESPLAVSLRAGRVRSDEHVIVRADQGRFPATYTATPIQRQGRVSGAVITFDDISERKQAQEIEQFLASASMTLSASLESEAVASAVARAGVPRLGQICFVDLILGEDRVLHAAWAHADPAMHETFDLDRSNGIAPRVPIFASQVDDVITTGQSMRVPVVPDAWFSVPDLPIAQRLGIRNALIVPLTLGARRLGALTFCRTDARQHRDGDLALAEEFARRSATAIEHARLYAQARQAVALREQTLAIVSHDLKTPLAAIMLSASILGGAGLNRVTPQSASLTAERIRVAAHRMDRMIEDLLDFASIEAGRLSIQVQQHDVAGIIDESLASFAEVASKGHVKLTATTQAGMPAILCDRDRILQVISNLLSNALKSVRSGDSISLCAQVVDRDAVFSVSDTGPGIAIADQRRMFERYWRSPSVEYKGTGLGLAIARGLVEAHRGRLWVESQPGHGATFSFSVPLAVPPEPPAAIGQAGQAGQAGQDR